MPSPAHGPDGEPSGWHGQQGQQPQGVNPPSRQHANGVEARTTRLVNSKRSSRCPGALHRSASLCSHPRRGHGCRR
jgi:hypothetical protein